MYMVYDTYFFAVDEKLKLMLWPVNQSVSHVYGQLNSQTKLRKLWTNGDNNNLTMCRTVLNPLIIYVLE